MSNIKIVRVTRKNYIDFINMIKWRLTEKRVEDTSYTKEELSYGNCLDEDYFYVYAAKVNNEMVGYLSASIIPKPDRRKGTLFIDEVWTQPSYRGRGIAKLLVNKMIEVAKEIEIWECRLTVDIDNPAARKVYKEAGFIEKTCIFGRMELSDEKWKNYYLK